LSLRRSLILLCAGLNFMAALVPSGVAMPFMVAGVLAVFVGLRWAVAVTSEFYIVWIGSSPQFWWLLYVQPMMLVLPAISGVVVWVVVSRSVFRRLLLKRVGWLVRRYES